MVKNVICCLLLISCSCSPTRDQRMSKPYHPKVGDSIEKVLFYLSSPYFGGREPHGGTIEGYLYDSTEERYSGFGTDMIDENKEGLKVVLLYYVNDIVRDILIIEGGVTDELLDGSGRELFQDKWRQETLSAAPPLFHGKDTEKTALQE